jgi:hypothetical protein
MSEEEILSQLEEAELDWIEAKRKIAFSKKLLMHAETLLIEIKFRKDNLTEALRVFRNTTPIQPLSLRELEIERFRKDNPEVCAFAKERDDLKSK